jgi:ABC-type phosphate transport system substrate-binding protein
MRYLSFVLLAVLLCGFAATNVQAAGVVIVANNSVPESTINAGTLQKIFLGKKSSWSDKTKIVPVMIKSGSARNSFLKSVMKKSDNEFNTFWMQNIFAGKGTPPKTFNKESELVNFVSSTPGAVGFVSAGTSTSGVKTILIK